MTGNRDHIEQEAQAHITLGILLQRQRKDEHKRAVERIVGGTLSTNKKIEAIRKLDEKYLDTKDLHHREKNRHDTTLANKGPESGYRAASNNYHHRPKHIVPAKAIILRSSWLRYMFKDYRLIKSFGERTMTLSSRFFPPKIRLGSNIGTYMARVYQREAKDLWILLNRVEAEGWLYLKKKEYNLLMVLRRFYNELMNTSFTFRKSDQSNVVDRYIKLENAFLILISNPEYVDKIIEYLEELKAKNRDFIPEGYDPMEKVKLLLTGEASSPSFLDFILAVNICKYRTFLKLRDLIRPDLEDPISAESFECSPSTAGRILTHIKNLQESLEKDREQLMEINSISQSFADELIKQTSMEEFYHHYIDESGDFNKAKQKIVYFIPQALNAYLEAFGQILNGRINIGERTGTYLFRENENQEALERLYNAADELRRQQKNVQILTYERYQRLLNSVEDTLESEFPVMYVLEDVKKSLNTITENCFKLLRKEEQTLEIKEVLAYPLQITHELKLYLLDSNTLKQRAEEDRIIHEIRKKIDTIGRIADRQSYQETKDRFISLLS